MKTSIHTRHISEKTWEEESGFLSFLSKVPAEVQRFEESFRMGLRYLHLPPEAIDGDEQRAQNTAFVVVRKNRLLPERDYCLYAVFEDRSLKAGYGIYRDNRITTVKEIAPLTQFKKAEQTLYGWLRELLKISCEKP
ncbi:MAG: hypothetical protein D6710_07310 [Nitrospirae bacterium]|nr:MAG: hypothetical protein D6710_07310 [Nitrospirota bacterium]